MRKYLKKLVALGVTILILSSVTMSASAKSLAKSFSGSSKVVCTKYVSMGGSYYEKAATAKTKGYEGYHYVRAYVGGSKTSAKNASADSGRIYSYGDVEATAQGGSYCGFSLMARFMLPTAYAKYGTE